jgi:replicative DNA helicase
MNSIEVRFLQQARSRKQWLRYGQLVRIGFFSTKASKLIWHAINKIYRRNNDETLSVIPLQTLLEWVETNSPANVDEAKAVLMKMKVVASSKAGEQQVVEFLQKSVFHGALEAGLDLLQDPTGLKRFAEVRDQITGGLNLSVSNATFYDYMEKRDERKDAVRQGLVSTGISQRLDDLALGGGLGVGECGILIGPTGRGKSQALCNIAANAYREGRNVLYCTLQDLPDVRIARRIDQILCDCTEEALLGDDHKFNRTLQNVATAGGKLFIRDFSSQAVSVYDIRAAVQGMIDEDCCPDVLCIDYLDTMISHTKDNDQNVVFGKILHELRRLGRDSHFAIWTASQGNRESLDSDEVRLSQIAGAIAKTRAADLVIGMSQRPAERDEGYQRWQILKTRMSSTMDSFIIFSNPDTMKFYGRREEDVQTRTRTHRGDRADSPGGDRPSDSGLQDEDRDPRGRDADSGDEPHLDEEETRGRQQPLLQTGSGNGRDHGSLGSFTELFTGGVGHPLPTQDSDPEHRSSDRELQ